MRKYRFSTRAARRLVVPQFLVLTFAATLLVKGADIFVTTVADGGNGTLRQAIQFNESLGGGNRILFSNSVVGRILLNSVNGELVINKDVTIVGPGPKLLSIDGSNTNRAFRIPGAASVS